jgi:replicative DNA helicase
MGREGEMVMNYEFQDQILGMVLSQHKRYWPEVCHHWKPEMFGDFERIKIAFAIKTLSDQGTEVNYATVRESLGGECAGLLIQLIKTSMLEVNIDWFMSQLTSWYNVKQVVLNLSDLSQQIIKANYSDAVEPVISELKNIADKTERMSVISQKFPEMPAMIESAAERIEQRITMNAQGKPRGVSMGLTKLDAYIAGIVGGRFYIVAARTSVGKTSFATWMALQAMKQGKRPLFFSNEMDKEDIIEKFIAAEAKVGTHKFQTGNLTDEDLTRFMAASNDLAKYNISIDEKSGWDLDELLTTVYRQHRDGKCDMVFVDYLQQVRVKSSKSKYEQVSTVSDAMKRLSRDLNIPVVGLAQINREAEKGGKEDLPSLSQLKDSGSLEQDADVVMILHKRDIADSEVALSISKNRYGMTGVTKLRHIHHFNIYEEA